MKPALMLVQMAHINLVIYALDALAYVILVKIIHIVYHAHPTIITMELVLQNQIVQLELIPI
jgi:hypothetical protein